ncbi:MAG TPA: WYL domain-containing protein [Nocardioidaceae bacterium]|nr:WYL domain-containing protein [Nocardioidaceae bacterium]
MSARKSERLMNLVICLLVARGFVGKAQIRGAVEGYHGLGDEAFERMFERDKDELRVLGVPIELGSNDKLFDDEVGYRIRRDRFELPELSLEADEAAVIGLAARVWQHARLASATSQALQKLRAGGADVDPSALAMLEPQLAADEPAFDAVFAAVTTHTPIGFAYRPVGSDAAAERHLEPWGIVSWHGHWYVTGQDRDRGSARMFRLSRVEGEVRAIGAAGSFTPPDDLDLRSLATSLGPPHPHTSATVRVRQGAGDALRRRAVRSRAVDESWSELEIPYGSDSTLVEELLSYGADVVVVGPEEVRSGVVRGLRAVAGAGTA